MANHDNTGFRPAWGTNSVIVMRFPIVAAGNSGNLFIGDAVKPESNGGITVLDAGATGNDLALGVVTGFYDSNGVSIGHPNSSISTKYMPASTAGAANVALALPGAIFIGQSQTGTTYTAADLFAGVNIVAGAGNTTLAFSGHELGTTGGVDCKILGLVNDPANAFGSENSDVYFAFMSSYWSQIAISGGV